MMQKKQLSYKISGEIIRIDGEYENYNDQVLINYLNENEKSIRNDIELEINNYSSEFININKVEVQLRFKEGSILADGWVIIEFLGAIAGTISFVEYFNKLINFIKVETQRAIIRNLPKYADRYKVFINVVPTSYLIPEAIELSDNKTFNLFKISPSNLLLSITLINIVFFLGGTLFSAFQVQSIQQKYDEANAKIIEAKVKIDSASQMLNTAKVDYQLRQYEIENIKGEVFAKRNQIISSLSSDTILIKAEVINVDTKLSILSNKIATLNDNAEKYDKSLKELNREISNLNDQQITFSFYDVWGFMNIYLKIIVCVIFTISLLTFAVILIKLFRN